MSHPDNLEIPCEPLNNTIESTLTTKIVDEDSRPIYLIVMRIDEIKIIEMKKAIKIISGAIAAILLGAIGSGVWEKMLSPGLTYTANLTTSLISSVSITYSNSIYERASNIAPYDETAILAFLILWITYSGLFVFALNSKKDQPFIEFLHKSFVRQFTGWWGIVQSGAFLVIIFFLMATQMSVSYIQQYSYKQMEILRPHIGDHEYHSLKSEFLQVNTKDDFNLFFKRLKELAETNHIVLDKFKNV